MLEAIIFDMDGVILDTEYVDFQLQRDFLLSIAKVPDSLTHADFSTLAGLSYAKLASAIKDLAQTDLSISKITEDLELYAGKIYQKLDYLSLFRSDMLAIIEYAQKRSIKLAVASSSRRKHIEDILETCGISSYFDCVLSGEDFAESKPNPEIYATALTKLQVAAKAAVAIEDSAFGIAAAKAAGLRVIAYQEERIMINQSQADYLEKDMLAILTRIQALNS